jgi:citrate lyase subunit beta / citryl-CoA lyase
MNNIHSIAGNYGPEIRSDCQVSFELRETGGLEIIIESKVKALYGESIQKACLEILEYFHISHARIKIDDSGALPFVIYARLEAAISNVIKSGKYFLPVFNEECKIPSQKDRHRITRLYLPGNTPKLMINAGIHNPDCIILDLEDSVAPDKKNEARYLVRNALRQINFFNAERMVRINQLPDGIEDLLYIIPNNVHVILLPKCESANQILFLESEINKICIKEKISRPIWLMPIIESALGIENSFEIATSSENIVAMAIGLEDYTADIGVQRTMDAKESFYARTRFVNACKAAKIQAIDSVFSDINDISSLQLTCQKSKLLGFEGMGCIHPRQINAIRNAFSPSQEEIIKAMKIVEAFNVAKEKGLGVIALGTKMIDLPVVKRAIRTIELAKQLNLIPNVYSTDELGMGK